MLTAGIIGAIGTCGFWPGAKEGTPAYEILVIISKHNRTCTYGYRFFKVCVTIVVYSIDLKYCFAK